jgi:hypothetical protein
VRGFTFDSGAHGVLERLMLRSGEWVRGLRTEMRSRGGVYSPRARRGSARGCG